MTNVLSTLFFSLLGGAIGSIVTLFIHAFVTTYLEERKRKNEE